MTRRQGMGRRASSCCAVILMKSSLGGIAQTHTRAACANWTRDTHTQCVPAWASKRRLAGFGCRPKTSQPVVCEPHTRGTIWRANLCRNVGRRRVGQPPGLWKVSNLGNTIHPHSRKRHTAECQNAAINIAAGAILMPISSHIAR